MLWLGLMATSVGTVQADMITVVQQMPTTSTLTPLYQTNRAPLQPVPFMKLPPGAIIPQGWLRQQLLLDAGGLPGRMEQISEYLAPQNGWVNTNYANGWEEVPYWLRGYQELGYVLNNQTIINDAVTNWIQKMMATQIVTGTNAGVFGPSSIYIGANDIWAQMPACEVLRHYYDYSHNPAVITVLTNYFNWLNANQSFIGPGWANPRWGDHLETMYWLYNITGQSFLLNLAVNIQNICGVQWLNGTFSWHNVNFAQGFREPAEYWMQSGNASHRAASENDYDQMMNRFGGYPGGGFSGDEVCRQGYGDPRQGFETCGHVEIMKSLEILMRITGNPVWADRCEEVAFNRLPTTAPPDHSGVCYLSLANSIEIVNQPQLHEQFDDSPQKLLAYMPGCDQYRCCPHNYAMGWPYYAEELWLATMDNGLCASLYAASQVQARVADGSTVTIAEVTDYPFSNMVNLTISVTNSQPLSFPLYLRVPRWCASHTASLQINGTAVPVFATSLSYIEIQRAWSNGDTVTYQMPMQLGVTTWPTNKNAVSINYGPLDFALAIQENWSTLLTDSDTNNFNSNWPCYQVQSGSPWNYGLVLNPTNLINGIQITFNPGPLPANPFVSTNPTISLSVPARLIPNWTADVDGLVGQLQPSPVISTQALQNVTLIPMGAARLRITTFPTIGTGMNANNWVPTPLFWPTPSASYCNPSDTVVALCDGIGPASSSDTGIQRFTWYGHVGTTERVEYDYSQPVNISSSSVYWYDDGGGVQLPVSWQLLYQDPLGDWLPVPNPSSYGTQTNAYNTTTFSQVTTRSVRLQVVLSSSYAAGILEWQMPIIGVGANPVYVDLRANSVSANGTLWTNQGVLGNFTSVATPVLVTNVLNTGVSGVYFNGNGTAYTGPDSVPAIDGGSARTVEVWACKTNFLTEETMLAEGTRGTYACNMAINWSPNTSWGAAAHWADDVGWPTLNATPSLNHWHYFVYTYDGNNTCDVYVDGSLAATGAVGLLTTAAGEPILVGAQRAASNAPPSSQWFQGYINSIRVSSGVLGSNSVAANYALGPVALPVIPTGLAGTAGNRQISLAWGPVSGATTYNLWRSTDNGGTYQFIATGLTTAGYVDTNAVSGRTNYYQVAAENSYGPGANSAAVGVFLPLPALGISTSAIGLAISWPGWANDWILSGTTNLTPPVVWAQVTNAAGSNSGQFNVSLPMDSMTRFFRLSSP